MERQALAIVPAGLSRGQRRKVLRDLRSEFQSLTPETLEEVSDLPGLGMFDLPDGLWIPNARPIPHRMTGWEFAGANPFAVSDIHDIVGPVIGIERTSGGLPLTFDPWELYLRGLASSTNLLVQGALRRGKSFSIKRLVVLMALFGRHSINTSDVKGEHGVVAEAIGGEVFRVGTFGSTVRLNPLETGERHFGESEDVYRMRSVTARQLVLQQIASLLLEDEPPLNAREKAVLNWALAEVIRETNDHPTIRKVVAKIDSDDLLAARSKRFERGDAQRLLDIFDLLLSGDLRGMFEDESSVKLNPRSKYTVVDTFAMAARGDLALAITQTISNAWVSNTISNKASGLKYLLIREEGWRDMNSLAALEAHRLQLKLSGEYGIAMVMIVHEDGDFAAVGPAGSKEREIAEQLLRGYANVWSFRQPKKTLIKAVESGSFTEGEAAQIRSFKRGEFLYKTDDRSYIVDATATATDWERELFNTDRAMQQLGRLEEAA
jgi:hypothetical protein